MKTRQLFLTTAIFFAGFAGASAQDLNFGIKAGANYSTLSGNEEAGIDYLPGYHVGLVAEFPLSPAVAIQPELFYSLEGAKSAFEMEIEEFFFSSEQKIKLGYINLPVMAKFYATEGFSLQAGPQLNYLLSGKSDYIISSNFSEDFDINESGTENIRDDLKNISFGVNFGLGYELNSKFFLQARYHLGLSDISDYKTDPADEMEVEFDKIRNRGFQLSMGYRF